MREDPTPASASRRDGFAVHMSWRTAGTVVLPLITARRHVAVAIVFAMAVPCIATGVAIAIAVSASASRRHGLGVHMPWRATGPIVLAWIPARRRAVAATIIAAVLTRTVATCLVVALAVLAVAVTTSLAAVLARPIGISLAVLSGAIVISVVSDGLPARCRLLPGRLARLRMPSRRRNRRREQNCAHRSCQQ